LRRYATSTKTSHLCDHCFFFRIHPGTLFSYTIEWTALISHQRRIHHNQQPQGVPLINKNTKPYKATTIFTSVQPANQQLIFRCSPFFPPSKPGEQVEPCIFSKFSAAGASLRAMRLSPPQCMSYCSAFRPLNLEHLVPPSPLICRFVKPSPPDCVFEVKRRRRFLSVDQSISKALSILWRLELFRAALVVNDE
jgi:hypothetical protein